MKERTTYVSGSRETAFDLLRVIAALFVIVIHVCAMQWRTLDIHSSDWIIIHLYDMLAKFSVPIFFMVSGRFFLDPGRTVTTQALFQKIFRLIVAFLFWSLIYTGLNILRVSFEGESIEQNTKWIMVEFFTGEYHMWFLYAIVGLYLITPFLRKITEDEKLTEYFLLMFFVFQTLVPLLSMLPKIGIIISTIRDEISFQFALGYSGYFVLGHYAYQHRFTERVRKLIYILGILGVVFTFGATLLDSFRSGVASERFAEYLKLNVACEALAVYVFVLEHSGKQENGRKNDVVKCLASYGFGIYLVHPLFLWIFEWIGLELTLFHPLLCIPAVTLVTSVLSFGATWLLRKIPKVGKFIT